MTQTLAREEFEELARAYIDFRNGGDRAPLETLMVDRRADPSAGDDLVEMDEMVRTAFPDWQMDLEHVWFDEVEQVGTIHFTASGTFEGEWRPTIDGEEFRFEPTGESFSFSGVSIFGFEDGVHVDTWGYKDSITFLTEAGMLPDLTEFASASPAK